MNEKKNIPEIRFKLIRPDLMIKEAIKLIEKNRAIDSLIVVENPNINNDLIGLVTRRDLRFHNRKDAPVSSTMTPRDRLVTLFHDAELDELAPQATALLHRHRTKRVLLVDKDFKFRGMIHEDDIASRKKLAFAILEFSEPYTHVYTDHVKPILTNEFDVVIERADKIFNTGSIIKTIQTRIKNADFIIADVSVQNPNVYYEVGFAHALKKDIVFITQDISKVPFDIRDQRCIVYSYDPRGVAELEENLRKTITELLVAAENKALIG